MVRVYMYANRPDQTGQRNGSQEDQTGDSFPDVTDLGGAPYKINPSTQTGHKFTYTGQTFTNQNQYAYMEFDKSNLNQTYKGANHTNDTSNSYMQDDGETLKGRFFFKQPNGSYVQGLYDGAGAPPARIFAEDTWHIYELNAAGNRVGDPFWVAHIEATDLNGAADQDGDKIFDGDSFTISERPLVSGKRYEVIHYDNSPSHAEGSSMPMDALMVQCFTSGTMIITQDGAVPVETLNTGDLVLTRDNGLQPIRWIGSRSFLREELTATPNLRPVRIRAGALGSNMPTSDLVVSPNTVFCCDLISHSGCSEPGKFWSRPSNCLKLMA